MLAAPTLKRNNVHHFLKTLFQHFFKRDIPSQIQVADDDDDDDDDHLQCPLPPGLHAPRKKNNPVQGNPSLRCLYIVILLKGLEGLRASRAILDGIRTILENYCLKLICMDPLLCTFGLSVFIFNILFSILSTVDSSQ